MKLSPIISAKELKEIYHNDDLIIVDAGCGGTSYDDYLKEHLQNALYVDLNKNLAEVPADPKNGGRHPLPDLEKFSKLLNRLGINEKSRVVVYDNKNATNAAPRFWWMLKSVGFTRIQVLDGGFPNTENLSEAEKLPLESGIQHIKSVANEEIIQFKNWKLPLVDINYIKEKSNKPDFLVVDVRDKNRYDGKSEPIDLIAGHIPGAINLPFTANYNEDGTLLPPEILKEKYQEIFKNTAVENISIHCGSGVTACNTLLALDYADLEIPNLYVGSWSEWSRSDFPIATI